MSGDEDRSGGSRAPYGFEVNRLLSSQCVAQTTARQLDVAITDQRVLGDIALKDAVERQHNRQGVFLAAILVPVHQSLTGEATHAVVSLAGFQVALGHRHRVTYRCSKRRQRRNG
jgi:hypothetical protein